MCKYVFMSIFVHWFTTNYYGNFCAQAHTLRRRATSPWQLGMARAARGEKCSAVVWWFLSLLHPKMPRWSLLGRKRAGTAMRQRIYNINDREPLPLILLFFSVFRVIVACCLVGWLLDWLVGPDRSCAYQYTLRPWCPYGLTLIKDKLLRQRSAREAEARKRD